MNDQDIEGLCVLVNSNFSFQDALRLLRDNKNEKCFNGLLQHLEKGEKIEQFLELYFPKKYCIYLKPFSLLLPFVRSLSLTRGCIYDEKEYRVNTLKELLYPLLLFVGTWLGLSVFTFLCFPTLISLFHNFSMDSNFLLVIQIVFKGICICLFILIICSCILVLLWRNKHCQLIFYDFICKVSKHNFIKLYQSSLFARFYKQCIVSGISTKESLQLLQTIEMHPILNLICKTVENDLIKGIQIEKALQNNYLDRTLIQYMKVAIYSSTMDEMLNGYIKINEAKMKRSIKRFAKGCQLVSYGCIGFIIIIVYQILILPLTLMAQM